MKGGDNIIMKKIFKLICAIIVAFIGAYMVYYIVASNADNITNSLVENFNETVSNSASSENITSK